MATIQTLAELIANRDRVSVSLAALTCQRRSGETARALRLRDEAQATLEIRLRELDAAIEAKLDTITPDLTGSASRQHFIDTGRYLTRAEVAEDSVVATYGACGPCAACNAEAGEPCRLGCIGEAAHQERELAALTGPDCEHRETEDDHGTSHCKDCHDTLTWFGDNVWESTGESAEERASRYAQDDQATHKAANGDALRDALAVFLLDKRTRAVLDAIDPQGVKQAVDALDNYDPSVLA